jgi:hypothetical protein
MLSLLDAVMLRLLQDEQMLDSKQTEGRWA